MHRFVVEEREGLGGEEELSATGRIFINDHQYFSNVAASVWGFGLGVHLPAQSWLKDRIGHKLEYKDVLHYQKILAVLAATDRMVREFNG